MPKLGEKMTVVALATMLLGGCGLFRGPPCDKPQPYQQSVSIEPVEAPEGLTEPDASRGLQIPERLPDAPPVGRNDPCLDKPPSFFEPEEQSQRAAGD